jgi:hypothetical protein
VRRGGRRGIAAPPPRAVSAATRSAAPFPSPRPEHRAAGSGEWMTPRGRPGSRPRIWRRPPRAGAPRWPPPPTPTGARSR